MVFLKWLARLVLGCCAIAAAWGAWYVVYQESLIAIQEDSKPPPKKPLAVEVIQARQDSVQERIVLVGNFLPAAQTEVRSLVNGYIRTMPFDVGDKVQVGQILCQIDDATHRDLVHQARARLEVAEAQLAVQSSEVNSVRKTLDREIMLDEVGAGTEEALETAVANHEIALARQKLEEARVTEVKSVLAGLELQLKDFKLLAPITGYVSVRMADVGDLAKPDVPIMQIVDLDKVLTTVQIIEKDYQKVSVGQSALVNVDAYPDQTFTGQVTRIAPTLEQETRTASIQIEVDNPAAKLKPGMYARVLLNSESAKAAVMIPLAAVVEINGRPFAYLVSPDPQTNEARTELRELQLGSSDGIVVEVQDGLKAGESVITLGNRLVQPGQAVVAQEISWSMIEINSVKNVSEKPSSSEIIPSGSD